MTNHFDNVAQDWDKNQVHIKRTEAIATEILKIIPTKKNLKALEFGAGTGLLSFALKDSFSEITLMDSSLEMINTTNRKIANSGIGHLHPIFFDLEKNDYNGKLFDFIFSQMALHHIDIIEEMVLKFYKLLSQDGQLAISDLYKEDGTFHDNDFKGHYGFNPDDLAQILSKQGFKQVNYNKCFEIPKEIEGKIVKNYPIFLLTAVK